MLTLPFRCKLPLVSKLSNHGSSPTEVHVEIQSLGFRVFDDNSSNSMSSSSRPAQKSTISKHTRHFWRTDAGSGTVLHPITIGFHSTVVFRGKLFEQSVELQQYRQREGAKRHVRPVFKVYFISGMDHTSGQVKRLEFSGQSCHVPWKVHRYIHTVCVCVCQGCCVCVHKLTQNNNGKCTDDLCILQMEGCFRISLYAVWIRCQGGHGGASSC